LLGIAPQLLLENAMRALPLTTMDAGIRIVCVFSSLSDTLESLRSP
jgi:hypothetical protein